MVKNVWCKFNSGLCDDMTTANYNTLKLMRLGFTRIPSGLIAVIGSMNVYSSWTLASGSLAMIVATEVPILTSKIFKDHLSHEIKSKSLFKSKTKKFQCYSTLN